MSSSGVAAPEVQPLPEKRFAHPYKELMGLYIFSLSLPLDFSLTATVAYTLLEGQHRVGLFAGAVKLIKA